MKINGAVEKYVENFSDGNFFMCIKSHSFLLLLFRLVFHSFLPCWPLNISYHTEAPTEERAKRFLFFNFVVIFWQIKFMSHIKNISICSQRLLFFPSKLREHTQPCLVGMLVHILWCFIESSVMPHIYNGSKPELEEKLCHISKQKIVPERKI